MSDSAENENVGLGVFGQRSSLGGLTNAEIIREFLSVTIQVDGNIAQRERLQADSIPHFGLR